MCSLGLGHVHSPQEDLATHSCTAATATVQVHHLTVMGVSAACVGGNMPWEQQQEIYDNIYRDPNLVKVGGGELPEGSCVPGWGW